MFGNYINPYATNPYAVPYQSQPMQMQQNQQLQNTQQLQQPIQSNNSIIWVQGEAGAKGYLMTPNTSLLLMDSEGEYFYIKTTDNTGMPTLKKYSYQEITNNVSKTQENTPKTDTSFDMSNYITREEFNEEMAKFKPRTNKTTKKEDVE